MKVTLWSLAITLASYYVAIQLFGPDTYLTVVGGAVVAAPILAFRARALKQKLPSPYGAGKVEELDARRSVRLGATMVLGGLLFFVVVFGSVFLVAPFDYFVALFSITGGLPMSQLFYLSYVVYLEYRAKSRFQLVVEDEERDGSEVILKRIELRPGSH